MKKVLVTGAFGQLAMCIKQAAPNFPDLDFTFVNRTELDVTDPATVRSYFSEHSFDVCINTAAYTNVEKAETEKEQAFAVNAAAVKTLAEVCKIHKTVLIHVSTDYVFDGTKTSPYIEQDATNPINVYGASKLAGEEELAAHCSRYFIIRTSWLYSEYGHNFFKTILRHANEGNPLTITTEQLGTPTNANNLAEAILLVATSESSAYGLYHYSNSGEASWYDFAKAILQESGQIETVNLAKTDHYRTFAKRPVYSILNSTKFCKAFKVDTINWRESLKTLFVENNNHK
ncbi:MAG: dTDP-4-dehydrorhamnose reductase [Flavobacterium sp.]|nr:MAG: dTDP-4-dehydrorhamnose reductase [Flavobacterium sp.]